MLTYFKGMKKPVLCLSILHFTVVLCFSQQKTGMIESNEEQYETTVSIARGKHFNLPDNYFGYNAQMMRGPSWQDPDFVSRVQQLKPQLIRYPGGTVASYWNWRTGWLKDGLKLKFDWAKIPENPIKLEDLKKACDATGAKPLFVLNMITGNLDDQFEMLEYAHKLGLPVNYVELDNEVYLGDDFYVKRFPTGIDYANESNIWIRKIKKRFPDVKISLSGYSAKVNAGKSKKKNFARTQTWNRDVLSVIENGDAMTFHVYGGNGLGRISKMIEDDDEKNSKDEAISMQKTFDSSGSIPVMLSIPFNRWKNADTYDYLLLPDGMKAWISEYNLWEREGVAAGTWAHGLYAITQTLLYFENPLTELICYHNLTTSAQFAAIFNNDNGFAKAVKKKKNKPYDFTAAGTCLKMFGEFIENRGEVTKLRFEPNEQLVGLRSQHYPSLYGWLCTSATGKKMIIVNLSDKSIPAGIINTEIKNPVYTQVTSKPHTQVAGPADVMGKKGKGDKILLLPYSVTIVSGE